MQKQNVKIGVCIQKGSSYPVTWGHLFSINNPILFTKSVLECFRSKTSFVYGKQQWFGSFQSPCDILILGLINIFRADENIRIFMKA